MKDAVQEAFEACYEEVACGVPLSAEVEKCMVFWLQKNSKRFTLLLLGWPGETIRCGVYDAESRLVVRHDGKRVPLHLFMVALRLPLLAMFRSGDADGS